MVVFQSDSLELDEAVVVQIGVVKQERDVPRSDPNTNSFPIDEQGSRLIRISRNHHIAEMRVAVDESEGLSLLATYGKRLCPTCNDGRELLIPLGQESVAPCGAFLL